MAASAPVTESIVAFALELELRDVPAAEVRRATRLLADTLGCAVAARGEPLAERLGAHARRHSSGDVPRATLLAASGGADLALAALANGTAVRMLDANDLYCSTDVPQPAGHPDAPLDDVALVAKLDEITDDCVGPDGGARLLEVCDRLPQAGDLAALFDLLRIPDDQTL
jgi:2-methylcitrate dehydratase PrpD